jgi:predicted RNase H-like HicB family nuclease
MEYVYPAIFHENDDDSYTITFPDLPGCISEGKSLGNALYMAQSALTQWLEYLSDKKNEIPEASALMETIANDNEFINLVRADIKRPVSVMATVSSSPTTKAG